MNDRAPRHIIIDTDAGIDDAVAILLATASPELSITALTGVAGNVALATAVRNACAVLELAERPEIPVYAGCPRPLAPHRIDGVHVHGESGLGGLLLAEPKIAARTQHAVSWLVETLRAAAARSLTICAVGPLTNLATALVMAPDIAAAVAELVIMGGGTHGNMTPAAEFNMYADPLAAAIVFESGVPITLVPLDVTELTASSPERVAAIRGAGARCAAAVAELLTPRGGWPGRRPLLIHDACTIAYLLDPSLFGVAEAHVAVETYSPLALGMTVIDRHRRGGRAANARVLDGVAAERLYRLLAERLALLP